MTVKGVGRREVTLELEYEEEDMQELKDSEYTSGLGEAPQRKVTMVSLSDSWSHYFYLIPPKGFEL